MLGASRAPGHQLQTRLPYIALECQEAHEISLDRRPRRKRESNFIPMPGERFERTFHKVIKAPPVHRTAKPVDEDQPAIGPLFRYTHQNSDDFRCSLPNSAVGAVSNLALRGTDPTCGRRVGQKLAADDEPPRFSSGASFRRLGIWGFLFIKPWSGHKMSLVWLLRTNPTKILVSSHMAH